MCLFGICLFVIRRHSLVALCSETHFLVFMQALVVTTLGGDNMGQRVDNLTSTEDLKRFYLQVRQNISLPPDLLVIVR